jgi:ubiquinone/menaquinone biosynthesis C-methylase UbiE
MSLPKYAMSQASFPEMYEHALVGPLFRPWAERLLERAALAPGERVLDVACGTGIVARLAKERVGDGRVVGADLSPQMLEVARALAPSIEWREANAGALPFEGASFDVVLCQQGLQFFPDRAAAAREMRRVLAPGGRAMVATWLGLEESPFFLALHRVGERHLGAIADQRHALGDAAELGRILEGAGLRDVAVGRESLVVRFADAATIVRMNAMAMVGMSARGGSLGEAERPRVLAAIEAECREAVEPFTEGDGVAFEMVTNLASGRA